MAARDWGVRGCLGLALLTAAWTPPATAGQDLDTALSTLRASGVGPVEISRVPATGFADFLRVSPDQPIQNFAVFVAAEDRARAFIATNRDAFIDAATPLELAITQSQGPDEVGQTHVRFAQSINGVPVRGGEISVHLTDAGVTAVNSQLVPDLATLDTNPLLLPVDAGAIAQTLLLKAVGPQDMQFAAPALEVLDPGVLSSRPGRPRLAWFIEVTGPSVWQLVWVDALNGELLLSIDQLTDARNRNTYDAKNTNVIGAIVRSENMPATGNADVDNAHDYAGDFYNYFFTEHQRDSWNGSGGDIISVARLCDPSFGCPMQNAFWNGARVAYGAGFAQDDIVAHELSHGVIQATANLVYQNESGALNESFADVFGETIDLTNGKGNDTAAKRWLMGEDLSLGGGNGIRSLMNPNAFSDPAKVTDTRYSCAAADNGGVHTNSGVNNHGFALMVDGGSFNGYSISGIGLTKAGKVEYRALSRYLTATSNFRATYNALVQSCSDLVGTYAITADDCAQVKNALLSVEMTTTPCGTASPPAKPGPAPAPTPSIGTTLCPNNAQSTVVFQDDMESTSSGNWVNTVIRSVNHWNGGAGVPPIYFTDNVVSGLNSLKATGRLGAGDSVVAMTGQVTVPQNAYLQFASDFNFETGYDGGVIEYSTNNGSSWQDAGSLITTGRNYTGSIVPGSDNPLAGRLAFTGNSGGYVISRLDLGTLAGRNVLFRFHAATDAFVASPGWYIDDVNLYQCAANTPPVAIAQNLTTDEDVAIGVVLTGSDADGNALTFQVSALPAHGVISGTAPDLTYRPQANYNGADSFQFLANDGIVDSAPQTITVQVTPVNDPPIANNRSVTLLEDVAASVTLTGVDVDGDVLSFRIVTPPAQGTLSGTAPDLSYTPNANYNGTDSFTYVVNDGTVDSPPATASLAITAVNDAPVATPENLATTSGNALTLVLNGSDVEGSPLSFRVSGNPSNGTLSGTAPNLTYTPAAAFSGADSFSFVVNDGVLDSAPAVINITVSVGDQAPVANGATLTVAEDQSIAITLTGQDPEGATLSYRLQGTAVANGVLTGTPPNLSYQPKANFNGQDQFSFVVNDGALDSAPATVAITVTPVNDAPVADARTLTIAVDQAANITLTGSDVEGSPLTYALVSQPANGTVTGTPPAVSYTPVVSFTGIDTFTFSVSDGALTSAAATVTINVIGGNVPVANAQDVSVLEDGTLALTLSGSGGASRLSFRVTQAPVNGTLTGTAPNLSYQPRINFNGTDILRFVSSDGVLDSVPATVTITVQAVNDAPVAQSINQGARVNSPISIQLMGSDVDGDALSYRVAGNPVNGVLAGTPPAVTYTPNTDFSGSDQFTYVVNDGAIDSAVATVTITVAQTTPPVANGQSVRTNEDQNANIMLTGTDADGDSLTFNVISGPAHGTLTGTPPALSYMPAANFNGTDQLIFNSNDGVLDSAPATVSIEVVAVNDAPVANDIDLSVAQDTPIAVPFSGSDLEGDVLAFKVNTSPGHGALISGAQGVSYRPAVGYVGSDSFTYVANDGNRNSSPATVTILVTPGTGLPRETPPTQSTPGISVTPISGLTTTEGGGIATFDIVLNTQPQADVVIRMSSSDTTEGRLLRVSALFTPDNWNTPQTIEVMGMTDRQDDGAVEYQIITEPAQSDDADYNGLDPDDVSVTNLESDSSLVLISPITGLTTTEFGKTASFEVTLSRAPSAGVLLRLHSSDDSEGKIVPDTISFSNVNWNEAQVITVVGLDDSELDGDIRFSIVTDPVDSKDPLFNGLDPPDISVVNSDNDQLGGGGGGAFAPLPLVVLLALRWLRGARRRFTGITGC